MDWWKAERKTEELLVSTHFQQINDLYVHLQPTERHAIESDVHMCVSTMRERGVDNRIGPYQHYEGYKVSTCSRGKQMHHHIREGSQNQCGLLEPDYALIQWTKKSPLFSKNSYSSKIKYGYVVSAQGLRCGTRFVIMMLLLRLRNCSPHPLWPTKLHNPWHHHGLLWTHDLTRRYFPPHLLYYKAACFSTFFSHVQTPCL